MPSACARCDFPTPALPSMRTSSCRSTNLAVASSKISERSILLKVQLKVSSVFLSRKSASLMRRSMRRSPRRSISSCTRSPRKSKGPRLSARACCARTVRESAMPLKRNWRSEVSISSVVIEEFSLCEGVKMGTVRGNRFDERMFVYERLRGDLAGEKHTHEAQAKRAHANGDAASMLNRLGSVLLDAAEQAVEAARRQRAALGDQGLGERCT